MTAETRARDRVPGHNNVASRQNAIIAGEVDDVTQTQRQIFVADHKAAGTVVDIDTTQTRIADRTARQGGRTDIADLKAIFGHIRDGQTIQNLNLRGIGDLNPVATRIRDGDVLDPLDVTGQIDTIGPGIRDHNIAEHPIRRISGQIDPIALAAGDGHVVDCDVGGTGMPKDAPIPTNDGQTFDGNEIRIIKLDPVHPGLGAKARVQRRAQRHQIRARADDREPFIQPQTEIKRPRKREASDRGVIPRVDDQLVPGAQIIFTQHVQRQRLGRRNNLARVTVRPGGGGVMHIAGVGGIIHKELVAIFGHGEGFNRAVEHLRQVGKADLNPQPIGAIVDPAGFGDPDELTIIRCCGRNGLKEGRAVDTVLIKINPHRRIQGVAKALPADHLRFVTLPIIVEIGIAQGDARFACLSGQVGSTRRHARSLRHGTRIGSGGARHQIGESLIENGRVDACALTGGLEEYRDLTCPKGQFDPVGQTFPAVAGVRAVDTHRLADLLPVLIPEGDDHRALIGKRTCPVRPEPATKDQIHITRVDLGRGKALTKQVDRLPGKARIGGSGGKISAALEPTGHGSRRGGICPAACRVGACPTSQPVFKARIDQQIGLITWPIGQSCRITGFSPEIGDALPRDSRQQRQITRRAACEYRLGQIGVDHRRAVGVQIKLCHIDLPIQKIGKAACPEADRRRASDMEQVVIAEETSLAPVRHIESSPTGKIKDRGADFGLGRAADHAHTIAGFAVDGDPFDQHPIGAIDQNGHIPDIAEDRADHLLAIQRINTDGHIRRGKIFNPSGKRTDRTNTAAHLDTGGQAAACDHTRSGHAHRSVGDHRIHHRSPRNELHARLSSGQVDMVPPGSTKGLRQCRDRCDHTRLTRDHVVADHRCGIIYDTHGRACDTVFSDQPRMRAINAQRDTAAQVIALNTRVHCRRQMQARRHGIPGHKPICQPCQNHRPGDRVAHQSNLIPTSDRDPLPVDVKPGEIEVIGIRGLNTVNRKRLNGHIIRVGRDDDSPCQLGSRSDTAQGHAAIGSRDGDIARVGASGDLDHITGAKILAVQRGLRGGGIGHHGHIRPRRGGQWPTHEGGQALKLSTSRGDATHEEADHGRRIGALTDRQRQTLRPIRTGPRIQPQQLLPGTQHKIAAIKAGKSQPERIGTSQAGIRLLPGKVHGGAVTCQNRRCAHARSVQTVGAALRNRHGGPVARRAERIIHAIGADAVTFGGVGLHARRGHKQPPGPIKGNRRVDQRLISDTVGAG